MTSRLAFNPIVLSHDGVILRLRPSLRAGLLMAQKYTLEELQDRIRQWHLGLILHLVAIGCDDIDKADAFVSAAISGGAHRLQDFAEPLFEFITISFGLSFDNDEPAPSTGKPMSFAEVFVELYEFATGALCWTPAEAWAATPAEIVHARKGHFAMLRAIHGSGDDNEANDPRDLPTDQEVQAGMSKLRMLAGEVR